MNDQPMKIFKMNNNNFYLVCAGYNSRGKLGYVLQHISTDPIENGKLFSYDDNSFENTLHIGRNEGFTEVTSKVAFIWNPTKEAFDIIEGGKD